MDPMLVQKAIARVADRLIQEAMREGKFDNLPGKGKPIAGLNQRFDEAKWVRDWARREQHTNGQFNRDLRAIRGDGGTDSGRGT